MVKNTRQLCGAALASVPQLPQACGPKTSTGQMTYTLVATAKNEAPYFLEWVAYHRMIGFDRIMVYQNDSDDLTDETLKVLDRIGAINYYYNRAGPGRHQVRAYKRASDKRAFREADWAIALDLDEFLHIKTGAGHLDDLFAAMPDTDMVLLNWRRFGNDGQTEITDDLVTQRFQRAEPSERIAHKLTPYKAIFRPSQFQRCGIHRPKTARVPLDQIRIGNGSGLPEAEFAWVKFRSTDPGCRKLAQINHYIVRDAASFVLKSSRGSAHQSDRRIEQDYWDRRNFNDEQDTGLALRGDEIRAAVAEMDAASGGELGTMRAEALDLHRKRFDGLMADPRFRDLYAFCQAGA
jgi:hypothetical protein